MLQGAKTTKRVAHVKEHGKTNLRIQVIVARVFEKEKNVKTLCFSHNSREILNRPIESEKKMKNIFGENVFIAKDNTSVEL